MTQPLRRPALASALALALAFGLAGCTGDPAVLRKTTAPTSPAGAVLPDLKIAFVEDLSPDGAEQRVAPAFQGLRLAVDAAGLHGSASASVRVVPMDTGGTSEGVRAVGNDIVGDATIVATVLAPELTGQVALGERLDAARVSTLSLSTLGPDPRDRGWRDWRRLVPDVEREAASLAAVLVDARGARGVCVLGDGSVASAALNRAVVTALPRRPALRLALPETDPDDVAVVAAIRRAACRSVVWTGTPTGGGLLRLALDAAGMRGIRLFGGEGLKDASYIATAGPRGRGTIAVCPCVDVSTSTDLRARRFIQDYQSAFGAAPGPFAAEAWDVGRMVLDAVAVGGATRADVADAIRTTTFDGLAKRYVFAPDGVSADGADGVAVYRDEGVRWVRVRAAGRGA